MFQKRKKFTEEVTPEGRMADRWDQQVFFYLRKYPEFETKVEAIKKAHACKQDDGVFIPTEEAISELKSLFLTMHD